ncbi:PREDICTED: reverse mRNAase [Prunus dulcis]|uniref:PREDICTED: reverse mRNAase n=1 Tax=Prunus dulcis TaxID=3755 RepID=A0A5E4GP30_PRUDU|nr:PREDICTED: reverse mRNAase [Prunus dulcis]VVA41363.1 PREDICTED: reverse mRNAase [Prunus dulcis]
MIQTAWNCQGMRNPRTVLYLKEVIRSKNPSVLFLCETKMNSHSLNQIKRRYGFNKGYSVDPVGTAGGLSLWWKPDVEVSILDSSPHWIDTMITSKAENFHGRFTWLYGTPYSQDKAIFWESFPCCDLKDGNPWIIMGDLNEVNWSYEKEGGANWNRKRRRFLLEYMEKNNLLDLGFKGSIFTWERSLGENGHVRERLDRALANYHWIERWPNACVTYGLRIGSDHCPIVLDNNPVLSKGRRIFRLEANWLNDNSCVEVIKNSLNIRNRGPFVNQWAWKLRKCK